MKNLGGLKYFLGIKVARSKQGIFLFKRKCILDLLAETRLLDCKPANTPIAHNDKLKDQENHTPIDRDQYQILVGKLIY